MSSLNQNPAIIHTLTGFTAVLGSVAGVISLVAATVLLLGGQFIVARVCLVTAFLSFAILANSVFFGARSLQRRS